MSLQNSIIRTCACDDSCKPAGGLLFVVNGCVEAFDVNEGVCKIFLPVVSFSFSLFVNMELRPVMPFILVHET